MKIVLLHPEYFDFWSLILIVFLDYRRAMPILYSVVARGTTVLAKFASCAGNFAEVTEQILSRIPPENSKLTYTQGK